MLANSFLLQVQGNDIVYSNAVLDSKMKQGGLKFFNSIRIPFKCKLSANQTISQGLNPMLNRLLTWKNGTGYLEIRLLLAYIAKPFLTWGIPERSTILIYMYAAIHFANN